MVAEPGPAAKVLFGKRSLPDSQIVAPPVADAKVLRAASQRLVRSRHSLGWLLGPDVVRRALFGDAVPAQIAVAVAGKRQRVVGVISWRASGRDPQPLLDDAMRQAHGRLSGPVRAAVYRVRAWLLAPARGSYVESIWVSQTRRGRGIGTALLAAMLAVAERPVHADVRRDNHRAIGYFRRHGFRPRRRPAPLLWLGGYRRLVLPREPDAACSLADAAHMPVIEQP